MHSPGAACSFVNSSGEHEAKTFPEVGGVHLEWEAAKGGKFDRILHHIKKVGTGLTAWIRFFEGKGSSFHSLMHWTQLCCRHCIYSSNIEYTRPVSLCLPSSESGELFSKRGKFLMKRYVSFTPSALFPVCWGTPGFTSIAESVH